MNLLITAAGIFTNVNKQYINGEWKEGGTGTKAHIVDPYDRSLLAEVVLAGREEVDEAYQSAKAAQKTGQPLRQRKK